MNMSNAELIATARLRGAKYSSGSDEYLLNRLSDALEAAEAERTPDLASFPYWQMIAAYKDRRPIRKDEQGGESGIVEMQHRTIVVELGMWDDMKAFGVAPDDLVGALCELTGGSVGIASDKTRTWGVGQRDEATK